MPIRGVHTADLHFGVTTYSKETPDGLGSRVHDFFRTFDRILEYIRQNHIDLLLITGDIFKDREPNSTLRNMFYKRVVEIAKEGVLVVIVPGNHDMHPFEAKHHSVKVFEIFEQENIVVMDKLFETRVFDIKGEKLRVIAVPYLYLERFIDKTIPEKIEQLEQNIANFFEEKLTEVLDSSRDDIPTILAGHFTVNEAEVGSERMIMIGKDVKVPLSVLLHPKLKFVALGHIHKPQILNSKNPAVVYCGSPDRIDFSETQDQKGFVVFEIGRENFWFEFKPVVVRPFYQLEIDLFEANGDVEKVLISEIDKKIKKLEENSSANIKASVVKLIIRTQSLLKERLSLTKVEEHLKDRCFILAPIEIEVTDAKRDFRIVEVDEKSDPIFAFERFLSASPKYKDIKSKDDVVATFKSLFEEVQGD
ncbi:exonuclease SbcCD subunit D [Caldicellulosiruptor changbaiensis]|uniref:Nuclease SbcCD subunit D n=1 Tax=Caldicellulosiruptor changbaiensis TaxID=1222016 RepID=A0A3T0D6H6_9FIRM|nr:exonuclease SbcCD subunit D [Caldicellulosiruptor changbaiensis]AZT90677.1 exonuclease SbcCD subunit D [Caldicellulosiruptor changbaiensis]